MEPPGLLIISDLVTMGTLGTEDVREGWEGGGGAGPALVPDQAGQLPPGEVNARPHLLARPGPHLALVTGQATDRAPGVAAVCNIVTWHWTLYIIRVYRPKDRGWWCRCLWLLPGDRAGARQL